MALHLTLAEHDANPPESWEVVKVAERVWHLRQQGSTSALASCKTRREAEAAKESGFYVQLWRDEGRWMRGEQVRNWRPYSEIEAERAEREARKGALA